MLGYYSYIPKIISKSKHFLLEILLEYCVEDLTNHFFEQGKMVLSLAKEPSARLLKHVVRCYLRLSDNPR